MDSGVFVPVCKTTRVQCKNGKTEQNETKLCTLLQREHSCCANITKKTKIFFFHLKSKITRASPFFVFLRYRPASGRPASQPALSGAASGMVAAGKCSVHARCGVIPKKRRRVSAQEEVHEAGMSRADE